MNEIPKISNKKLEDLLRHVKPVISFVKINEDGEKGYEMNERGDLYYIRDVDPKETAYTWDPEPTIKAKGLKKLDDITTYHTYGYHGFFKPSIAEVLAQIPDKYIDDVVAFQTFPDSMEMAGEYHCATTRLYKKK